MSNEALVAKVNQSLHVRPFRAGRTQYDSVAVLTIYWADADSAKRDDERHNQTKKPSFKSEAKQVRDFFREYFNYQVEPCEIPLRDSFVALNTRGQLLFVHSWEAFLPADLSLRRSRSSA